MASGSRFRFKTSLSKPESDEPRYAPEGCYLGAGPDAPVSVCITENPNFQNWRETGLPPILPGADVPWWQDASLPVGPQPSLADALYDEKTERLSVRRIIAGALSRVSKEVGESFRDSVNAFDPRKVAAQVESVCITENPNFQNWRETGLPPILPGADVPWWQNASLPVGPQPSLADALYDEKTERLSVRRMIAGALSRVSKEVGESFRDSVNAFDPRKVAAQVESVLFDNWGFRDESNYDKYEAIIHFLILDEIKEFRRQVLVGEIPPEMLLNMSFEQLQQRYPRTRSYLDYIAPK